MLRLVVAISVFENGALLAWDFARHRGPVLRDLLLTEMLLLRLRPSGTLPKPGATMAIFSLESSR